MRRVAAALLLTALEVAAGEVVHFNGCDSGGLPPHWSVAMTHSGGAPKWWLIKDRSAPSPPCVLAQLSTDSTAGRFPLAIWDGAEFRDGEVAVAFKPVAGTVDQAAGIVWRYRDPNDYYIVRANALESNVVLYKVQNGIRASIPPMGLPSRAYGVKHSIASGHWATLRVSFQSKFITIFLNGEKLFIAEDGSIESAGKTGLWTKADSITYFDDFEVQPK